VRDWKNEADLKVKLLKLLASFRIKLL